jgi:hypothetical protein
MKLLFGEYARKHFGCFFFEINYAKLENILLRTAQISKRSDYVYISCFLRSTAHSAWRREIWLLYTQLTLGQSINTVTATSHNHQIEISLDYTVVASAGL